MPQDNGYQEGNQVILLQSGSDFFNRLFLRLSEAKRFIHIHIYILGHDKTGLEVLRLLKEAAARGVQVYLLVDQFGSPWLTVSCARELSLDSLHIKRFARRVSYKRLTLGRRQHAKVCIVDNELAFISGLNYADRYSGLDGQEPWLDYGVEVQGPIVGTINHRAAIYWPRKIQQRIRSFKGTGRRGEVSCRLSWNDWLRNRFQISRSYRKRIQEAQEEIILVVSYFYPSPRMLRLIMKRAKEGVKVKVFLSRRSDVPFMRAAMNYFYSGLLRNGAEIYEWDRSILHAKLLLVDGRWASVGSYNLNQLSDYGSLEANLEVQGPLIEEWRQSLLDELTQGSAHVTTSRGGILRRLGQLFSFLLIRLALKVLFLRRTLVDL
ncbi:MAG: hypothetical protein EP332_13990 [Bacteroidetes bacterium]|nr:MAG: hypothetical protein EP332_13990 [Bacteroidota bacterium]